MEHNPQPPYATDFLVGYDHFDDLEIADGGDGKFFYFRNIKKSLVKKFVLKRTDRTEKNCTVTLIKREDGQFEPRFDLTILDLSKKAVKQVEKSVDVGEVRLIKAKVNLNDCHEEFSSLVGFIRDFEGIAFAAGDFAVVSKENKEHFSKLLDSIGKDQAVEQFAEKYSGTITETDLSIIAGRKKALAVFERLLVDPTYFMECKQKLGVNKRDEDVWQKFFEKNHWIFGYGLQLYSCQPLNNAKLEQIAVGADLIDGAGKRTDALLKTRGWINRFLFCEIKTHNTRLVKKYDRPGVYVPATDLAGAIGQVQKTIHKVQLKMGTAFQTIADKEGVPSGEQIAFIRPRGIVVAGKLQQFDTEHGINEEEYASFELFRQQLIGVELITFDELYERARYIAEPD